MFTRLRTKLAVLYAAVFGATLLVAAGLMFTAISQTAQRQVRDELTASGTVFDRVWSLRSQRLHEGAALLSRDFGFREAVATGDAATVASALENLKRRMAIERAFIVRLDGQVAGEGADKLGLDGRALVSALEDDDTPSGVVMLRGEPYQAISAPLMSPDLAGWVVFFVRLDRTEMGELERLAAIPLHAAVLAKGSQGWRGEGLSEPQDRERLIRFIEHGKADPRVLDGRDGGSIALVKRLPALKAGESAVLVLRYPLALALKPYRPLLTLIVLVGLAAMAAAGWGAWAVAQGVTRPISELDDAAHRLQRGEDAQVAVQTKDEIGRLAASFNTMATAMRDRERRITHLALHDGDTGLPNRLHLERVVADLSDRPAGQVHVAALGIQRFDHVRGAIGYALAAQAVRMIGNRLGGMAPGSGVARISTDVLGFVMIAAGPEAAADDAARLLARLEEPLKVGGGDAIDVDLALGLAPLAPGQAADQAIELASIALDQARRAKRKTAFFDAEAYGDPASNLALMSGMLRALESGEIELHYQPKYDLRGRCVAGAEGLVRWRHPVRGMLAPDLFIPMAEETGHIRTLTEWVVRRAVADQCALVEAGHAVDLAVNISGRTLGEPDFADFALAEARKAPGRLSFEITETAVIENPRTALQMLDRFAEAGIGIAIDDFGSGLSSLAYLKRIRGQELKIDKSIVQGVTDSQRDALIVRSTIDLAHSLGLKVTAEGVETNACFSLLAAMGCDQVQGYLIAKPLPCKEFLTFLADDPALAQSHG